MLYKLITSDNKTKYDPNPVGEVELAGEKTIIKVADKGLKEKIEKLFSKPFGYLASDTTDDSHFTVKETAVPNTRNFLRQAKFKLLEIGLKGVVKGDWE